MGFSFCNIFLELALKERNLVIIIVNGYKFKRLPRFIFSPNESHRLNLL